jgi:diaminopimelate decarboxylase
VNQALLQHTPDGFRVESVAVAAVAAALGTPSYVYSAGAIRDAYLRLDRAFGARPHAIHYALKANSTLALVRLMRTLGSRVDANSMGEVDVALRCGFAARDIVFTGVGKSAAELARAVTLDVHAINVESPGELDRLDQLAVAHGRRVRVALRVNPDIDARSHPHISTGLRDNKFGVDIAAAADILRRARRLPGIEISGVQCHIGSQITDLGPLQRAAADLVSLSRRLMAEGVALRTIDIGGGLGIDYTSDAPPPVDAFAAAVLPLIEGLPLTLLLEPGRSLVARAGVLVTRVLVVKENHGKRFVVVDAGMTELLRPALYGAYHRIQPVGAGEEPVGPVDVVGPVCETADFLARGRDLPTVEAGALLAIRDVGAYGFSMASTYNMRPRAAEALVDGGRLRLIRRRETFDDMVRAEIID